MFRFIVNPAAKSWQAREYMEKLGASLKDAGVPFESFETEGPGQAGKLSARLARMDTELLGVVGGDGTLNEIVNGEPEILPPIFYVPFGSGNDFARGIKLRTNAENALQLVTDRSPLQAKPVDIGRAEAEGETPRRFIVSAGVGFDAAVCYDMDCGKLKKALNKIHLGFLGYLFLGLKNMFSCPLTNVKIILNDGEEVHEFKKLAFCSAHDLPYEGGGFYFAPKAVSHDGLIDLCVVTARNHLRFICCLLGSVFGGKHIRMKGVHYFQCRKAELILERPLWYHTDGEVSSKTAHITFATDDVKIRILQ